MEVLILKDMFLVVLAGQVLGMRLKKRKAGAGSRTPNRVLYRVNYTRG